MKPRVFSALVIVLISGCHDSSASTQTLAATAKVVCQAPVSSPKAVASNVVAFDIPKLLKLSVKQLKTELGTPADELQANVTDTERSLVYKKKRLLLTVDYIVGTEQIADIALANERDTSSYQHLLSIGNLIVTDTMYQVEPLPGEKAGSYHGILITPNPPPEFPVTP